MNYQKKKKDNWELAQFKQPKYFEKILHIIKEKTVILQKKQNKIQF